jgi:hypothetical protein
MAEDTYASASTDIVVDDFDLGDAGDISEGMEQ